VRSSSSVARANRWSAAAARRAARVQASSPASTSFAPKRAVASRRCCSPPAAAASASGIAARAERDRGAGARLGIDRKRGGRGDRDLVLRHVERGGDELREAEIEELDLPVFAHRRVGGLDVAVDDAAPMRRREAASEPDADRDDLRRGDGPLDLGEAPPADVLGDEERPPPDLANAMHGDDVRMREPRYRPCLREEALAGGLARRLLRRDELHRHEPLEELVLGEVHLTHRAAAEGPHDAVLLELDGRAERV
jgi:hypothetical protein